MVEINEDRQNTASPRNVELLIRPTMSEAIFNGDADDTFVLVSRANLEIAMQYLSFIDPAYQDESLGSQETPELIKNRIVTLISKKKRATKSDISHGIKIKYDYSQKKVKSESKIIGELLDELVLDDILNASITTSGNNKPVTMYSLDK